MTNDITRYYYLLVLWLGFYAYYFVKIRTPYKCNSVLILMAIYFSILFMYTIIGISDARLGNYPGQIMFFSPILLYISLTSKCNIRQIKYIFIAILTIAAINIIDSIRLSILYPASTYQLIVGELEDVIDISNLNIGGTSFITMTLFYMNVTLYSYFRENSKHIKLLYLLYTIIAFYFIVFCSFKAAALIYAILSIVVQYIATKSKSPMRMFSIAGVIALFLLIFIEPIVELIVAVVGSERIAERLLGIIGNDTSGASQGRGELFMISINSWLSSIITFFFGIGDHRSSIDAYKTGISQHADLLDNLARYGIMGFLVLYGLFKRFYLYVLENTTPKERFGVLSFLIVLVLCGCTKKLFYFNTGLMIFFLFPISVYISKNKEQI